MIDSKDISVIVQGAIDKRLTPVCLASIRTHLPDAAIILSTWKGMAPEYLDYDILVESEDPDAYCIDTYGTKNNVNRQILSTKNGLARASTLYALKMRSDMEITGTSFLHYFFAFPARSDRFKLLRSRLVISNLYTSNAEKTKFLFHPSDWICFGFREDVAHLWDIDLAPEPETSAFFRKNKKQFALQDPVPTWKFRYIPEQYICLAFVKKFCQLDFQHYLDYTPANLSVWNAVLANNFVVLDYHGQLDMRFLKYDPDIHKPENQLTHFQWLKLYKELCDTAYQLPLRHKLSNDPKRRKLIERLRSFYSRFTHPLKAVAKWTGAAFSLPYCVMRLILREADMRARHYLSRR